MTEIAKYKNIVIDHFTSPDRIVAEIMYPRNDDHLKHVEISLSDVRASDNIRVSYDFDRDGWKIEQGYVITEDKGDYIDCTNVTWEEVGFFPAWNLEHKGNDNY